MHRLLLASLLFALTVSAQADVTVARYFRLGETDPGAIHGAAAGTRSTDSTGIDNLVLKCAPHYSADVANANSTLSLEFNGTKQYATTGNWNNLTTNFGVEVWVKPDAADGEHYIIYNGNSTQDGWGIIQNPTTGKFGAIFGGVTTFGTGTATIGVWTHLAIVCTDTGATFYVNGVASGTTTSLPYAATGFMAIAANATTPAASLFGGKIDEVRIFTFAPGAFSTSDLLVNAPALPPTLSLQSVATQDQLIWPTWDRGFGLQTSTSLLANSWTSVSSPGETNGVYSVTLPPATANRFYRLKKPCGTIAPPMLPAGKFIVLTTAGTSKNVTNLLSQTGNRITGNMQTTLDASAFIDPADCNGDANSLDFGWRINYIGVLAGFSDVGTTGYLKPVLTSVPSSLANQPSPFTPNGAGVQFLLVVHSRLTNLSTTVDIRAQVVSSSLSLTIYNDCQFRTAACATSTQCLCTIAAALPTTEPTY